MVTSLKIHYYFLSVLVLWFLFLIYIYFENSKSFLLYNITDLNEISMYVDELTMNWNIRIFHYVQSIEWIFEIEIFDFFNCKILGFLFNLLCVAILGNELSDHRTCYPLFKYLWEWITLVFGHYMLAIFWLLLFWSDRSGVFKLYLFTF